MKITLFIILLLSINNVLAIAMSPVEYKMQYSPGTINSCGFNLKLDNGGIVNFRVKGELNQSVKLDYQKLKLEPNQWYTIGCQITLPENLKPGPHEIDIISVEGAENLGGNVGAVGGLVLPIEIFVPYPGKYLEIIKLELKDMGINETQEAKIGVVSRGDQTLENVYGIIDIYDDKNIIYEIKTNNIKLEKNKGAELTANIDSSKIPVGEYTAIVTVKYDEKETKTDKSFRVGDILINIEPLGPKKAKVHSINSFNLKLNSKWNANINDIYIMLTVLDNNGNFVNDVKSETFEIGPWSTIQKTIFWDSKELKPGNYQANFTAYYSGKKNAETKMDFELYETLFDKYPITNILLGVIILILLIMLTRNYIKSRKDEKN